MAKCPKCGQEHTDIPVTPFEAWFNRECAEGEGPHFMPFRKLIVGPFFGYVFAVFKFRTPEDAERIPFGRRIGRRRFMLIR